VDTTEEIKIPKIAGMSSAVDSAALLIAAFLIKELYRVLTDFVSQ
jgi:hypothetical protein